MTDFAHYNEVWQEGYEEGQKDAAPKWTPVSEGLPEENKRVFVTAFFPSDCGHMEIGILSLIKGKWTNGFCSDYDVRAWMPLPEPWKEEEDE